MKERRLLRPWWPPIVASFGAAVTLLIWQAMLHHEHTQITGTVKLATYSVQADMISDIDVRIRGLIQIAKLWEIWKKPSQNEFRQHSTLFIGHHPGCLAIGWVGLDYKVRWIVPVDGDDAIRDSFSHFDEGQRKWLRQTLESRSTAVAPSFPAPHDQRYLPIWVPVSAHNHPEGFILGIFQARTLINDITADYSDWGYEIQVFEGTNQLYQLLGTVPLNEWYQEATVELPGADWRVRLWPSEKALPSSYPLSRTLLMGGLSVSALLTLAILLAQRAALSATNLELANRELTKENEDRRRAEDSLRDLSARVLQLQDEERRHIARELHDSTAQSLFGLTIKLRLIAESESPDDPECVRQLSEGRQLADQCLSEMRTMSYLLHPPSLDDLGLVPALRSLAKGFTERSGILVDMQLPSDLNRLHEEAETALFRIVQESLSNIHRHSGSRVARIELEKEDKSLVLRISDRGRGIATGVLQQTVDPTLIGVGIAGMRARLSQLGGKLQVKSSSQGTTVVATLPLGQPETHNSWSHPS
jgi:signal transduction histidine kinase